MANIGDIERFVFVVGAPRCGTTTLSRVLKDHPQIAFPIVKEPHFFSQNDLRGLSDAQLRERVQSDYLDRFFPDCSAGTIGADCSVTYLYTPEQLEPILRLWPKSRFIVAVRDPLKMLPSLHQRLLYLGDETIRSFGRAWNAIESRAKGRRVPRRCADPRWLRYEEAGRFGTYLERLFRTVGRDRCWLIAFDDFAAEPRSVARDMLDFLELDQPRRIAIPRQRAGKDIRSIWLQRLLKRPPKLLFDLFAPNHHKVRTGALPADDRASFRQPTLVVRIRKRLLQWNRTPSRGRVVDLRTQREICRHYADEIRRLGQLVGRDFSHWLRPTLTATALTADAKATSGAGRAPGARRMSAIDRERADNRLSQPESHRNSRKKVQVG